MKVYFWMLVVLVATFAFIGAAVVPDIKNRSAECAAKGGRIVFGKSRDYCIKREAFL